MDRPRVGLPANMLGANAFLAKASKHELGQLVVAQCAGIDATGPEPRGRHQGRGRQSAAMAFPTADRPLGVGLRIRVDVQQFIDRRIAQSENVEGFDHGVFTGCMLVRLCGESNKMAFATASASAVVY